MTASDYFHDHFSIDEVGSVIVSAEDVLEHLCEYPEDIRDLANGLKWLDDVIQNLSDAFDEVKQDAESFTLPEGMTKSQRRHGQSSTTRWDRACRATASLLLNMRWQHERP